jgi:hypothetical protein
VLEEAIRRFLKAHRPELREQFIREDVEWGLRGRKLIPPARPSVMPALPLGTGIPTAPKPPTAGLLSGPHVPSMQTHQCTAVSATSFAIVPPENQ